MRKEYKKKTRKKRGLHLNMMWRGSSNSNEGPLASELRVDHFDTDRERERTIENEVRGKKSERE